MKIGLCIGGGGSRGYAVVPIIQKLLSEGIRFDAVSGCSVGSIIGSYLALNGNLDDFENEISKINQFKFLRLIDFAGRKKSSILYGKKIKKFLNKEILKEKKFSDLKIPLFINSTDLSTGKPYYFQEGFLIDGVMSSIAIPGVFPPYLYQGKILVDGGVCESLPIRILKEKVDKIIAVSLNEVGISNIKIGLSDVLFKSLSIMMNQNVEFQDDPEVKFLKPVFTGKEANFLKFYKHSSYFQLGKKVIDEKIQEIKEWIGK
ncbi:MAG: hypothetical protein A2Y41_00615 [Spirochaetes bacterium GWB1_36_13]|nr:MAG: hypothetical protein A2Y41_00615 [Spirochaetes bacterium GWB1_36_13]